LLVPVVVLAGYQLWTGSLYGHGLLSDAAAYAGDVRFRGGLLLLTKAVVGLSFAGGCLVSVGIFAPWLWSGRALAFAGVAALFLGGSLVLSGRVGPLFLTGDRGVRWASVVQLVLLAVAGAGLVAAAFADLARRRDPEAVLLFLWVAGTLLFTVFFNWSVNARSLLPVAPAAGILVSRRLELRGGASRASTAVALAAAALLSFAAAWADFRLAGAAREAAPRIVAEAAVRPGTLWFEGHWGFQRYMEQAGAKPLDVRRSRVQPGDRIAVPLNNTNLFLLPPGSFAPSSVVEVPVLPYLSTLSPAVGAGFYTDVWGPLPFAFGSVPPERYAIVDVLREIPPGEIAR